MIPKERTGELVTYKNGEPIGGERWRDDGNRLTTEIDLAGSHVTSVLDRSQLPSGTIALENGSWQSYSVAAEAFPNATEWTPVKISIPSRRATVNGKIRVRPSEDESGGTRVQITIGALDVIADVKAGTVVRARVPEQQLEARPRSEPAPERSLRATRPAPATVDETPFEVASGGAFLRGVVWAPKPSDKTLALAIVVAGSGPTDRDGNSTLALKSDMYRQIAEGLAAKGIATLRYDKRGVGESSLPGAPASWTIEDFASDLGAVIAHARATKRFSKITVIGHSEGGLVALLLARTKSAPVQPDALMLAATAGRPLRAVLREQLATKLDQKLLAEADRLLAALAAGHPLENVPRELAPLFNSGSAAFLRSEIEVDPAAVVRSLSLPIAVVQGETDAQVSVQDAKLLGAARRDIRVTLLPHTNHLFKEETSGALPQASYLDPSRPLVPAALDAIANAVVRR